MKFRVDRDVLADAVNWAARTLPARPAVPVLAGVRLQAEEGVLRISSFDYEVSARSEVVADIAESGDILVSGQLLAKITKLLPNQPVSFTLDGPKAVITCGAARFNLMTMPVEDYPILPVVPETTGRVDAGEFAKAIQQVSIAASKDETLPLLTGVKVEIEGENITLLATDRYRLAMREMKWIPAQPSFATQALLKARTLTDAAKSMVSTGPIEIALASEDSVGPTALVGFKAGGRTMTSLLIDGDYPPVRRLFPESTAISAVVDRQSLSEAVKRVSLVVERDTPVRLTFTENSLALEAGQGEDAQASEEMEVDLIGENITTAFNPHYLADALAAIDTDYVKMSFTHPAKPAILTGQEKIDGGEQLDFRYLLMPIRFGI